MPFADISFSWRINCWLSGHHGSEIGAFGGRSFRQMKQRSRTTGFVRPRGARIAQPAVARSSRDRLAYLSLDESDHVKTTTVETAERGRSPLGARVRFLMNGPHGNMIHSTVPPGMVGRACHFRTVDEYWYVLAGEGEIWRSPPDGHESITRLIPGVCVDIPLGTVFQYRCTGSVPLVFTCTALPPWPGDDEAVIVDGPWVPRVDPEPGGQPSD